MKYLLLLLAVLFAACSKPVKTVDSSVLKETDRAFSEMSVAKGMNAAFVAYADSSVFKIEQSRFPVVGLQALADSLALVNDTNFTLSWAPIKAEIAASGDLGYTVGKWYFSASGGICQYGVYVTVWKLQPNGEWKFVVDAGADTPGEFQP